MENRKSTWICLKYNRAEHFLKHSHNCEKACALISEPERIHTARILRSMTLKEKHVLVGLYTDDRLHDSLAITRSRTWA